MASYDRPYTSIHRCHGHPSVDQRLDQQSFVGRKLYALVERPAYTHTIVRQ